MQIQPIFAIFVGACNFAKFLQFLSIKGATRKILTSIYHHKFNVHTLRWEWKTSPTCPSISSILYWYCVQPGKITPHLQLARLFNLSSHHQNKPYAGWPEKSGKTGSDGVYGKCGIIIRTRLPIITLPCVSLIKTTNVTHHHIAHSGEITLWRQRIPLICQRK